ncbi:MAG TPA: hypothetical protein VK956_12075 [Verrucomicrobium sp.]|nr:hypothetical protein [Verrucomicrobium sp.]
MKTRYLSPLAALLGLLPLPMAGLLQGVESTTGAATPVPADPDLPKAFDPTVADTLISAPPFTRSLNLSDSLVLTGIAYIEGKPVATILNKQTKENFVVSEEPNAQGWKLAETSATVQLNRTQAKIMVGSEMITVRYSNEQLTPESMKKGGFRPGGDGRHEERRDDGPRRERRGPSEEDRKRFEGLSPQAREKFFNQMRESREKMTNATQEERTAYVKKIFDRVEKDDKGGSK